MAGHPMLLDLTAFPKVVAENLLNPRERKRNKREREVLPNPIPDPTPVCSCAENRTGPKQALRLVRPHAPLVVRKARKTLG